MNRLDEKEVKEIESYFESKLLAADPITWSVVYKKIAEGFLKAIASEVLKKLLGGGLDPDKLLKNILDGVDRIVVYRLEQAFIKQAMIRAEVVHSAILDYTNAPSKKRLHEIEQNSRWLVAEFESYKHKTYKEYIIAVSYRLFAYEEEFKQGNQNEKDNIIRMINDALQHIDAMNREWKGISDRRFKVDQEFFVEYDWEGRPIGSYGSFWVEKTGKRISKKYGFLSDSRGRRAAERDAKRELVNQQNKSYQIDVLDEYVDPAEEITDIWRRRRDSING